jgi:hypothetical protein
MPIVTSVSFGAGIRRGQGPGGKGRWFCNAGTPGNPEKEFCRRCPEGFGSTEGKSRNEAEEEKSQPSLGGRSFAISCQIATTQGDDRWPQFHNRQPLIMPPQSVVVVYFQLIQALK